MISKGKLITDNRQLITYICALVSWWLNYYHIYLKLVKTMTQEEKRLHPRFDALNLIAYDCVDESGQVVMRGMGRTLNVSEGGILLETHIQIEQQYDALLSIGLENDLIDIKGKIVFSKPGKVDKFEAGIKFLEIGATELDILKLYIKAFKNSP